MKRAFNLVGLWATFIFLIMGTAYYCYSLPPGYVGDNPLCNYSNTTEVSVKFYWSTTLQGATCENIYSFASWWMDFTELRGQTLSYVSIYDNFGRFVSPFEVTDYDTAGVCAYYNVNTYGIVNLPDPINTWDDFDDWEDFLVGKAPAVNGWAVGWFHRTPNYSPMNNEWAYSNMYKCYSFIKYEAPGGIHNSLHQWGHLFFGVDYENWDEYWWTCTHSPDNMHYPPTHNNASGNTMQYALRTNPYFYPDHDNRYKPFHTHVYDNH